jgi:uncharacterized lipoprotein YbaY
MRTIQGAIVLPTNAPRGIGRRVTVEVRDVSVQDAPSIVIARKDLTDVTLEPTGQLNFELEVPDVDASHALSLRVHISMDGSGQIKDGDLLTTSSCPITPHGATARVTVSPKVI